MFGRKTKYKIQNLESEVKWLNEQREKHRDKFYDLENDINRILEYFGLEKKVTHKTEIVKKAK
jgi:hypothetical protein